METNTPGMSQAAADVAYNPLHAMQYASPTTGQSVPFTNDSRDRTLWLTPAGTIAALTVPFPTSASSRPGRTVTIGTSKSITILSLTGPISILNAITTMVAGDAFTFREMTSDVWAKI